MKLQPKILLLLISFLFLLQYSCGPKEPEQIACKIIKLAPKDFINYWQFPVGSQWIYKLDSSADIYDTVTATRVTITNGREITPYELSYCAMRYTITLDHSNTVLRTYHPKGSTDFFQSFYDENSDSWCLYHIAQDMKFLSYGDI